LRHLSAGKWVSSYWEALVLLGLGRHDEALARLRAAVTERFDWVVFIGVEPLWDPVRDRPEFQELVQAVGKGGLKAARRPDDV